MSGTERQVALEQAKRGKPVKINIGRTEDGDLGFSADGHVDPADFAEAVKALVLPEIETGFYCSDCEFNYSADDVEDCKAEEHRLEPITLAIISP